MLPKLTQTRALYYAGMFNMELEVIGAYETAIGDDDARWWQALYEYKCLPVEYMNIEVEMNDA